MNKYRIRNVMIGSSVFLIVTVLASICLGSVHISLGELWQAFFNGMRNAGTPAERILWYARIPRTIACVLAGAALAVSGAVIQSVLNNQLASPGIIGVNAGAGFGVTICFVLGMFTPWKIAGAAFAGAMGTVFLVTFVARKIGASRTTVILGGVAMNSCLNAASEAMAILVPEAGMQAADFRVGGFSSVAMDRLLPAGLLILISLAVLMTLTNELDVLALGEDTAQGLGMPVRKMRNVFLLLSALLAGAAVSFSGLLGFVGLIIPHVGRKLVSNENGKLLPFCTMFGAAFVTLCDLASRTLFSPYELPVGILLSFLGGPFFIVLLIRKRGGHRL